MQYRSINKKNCPELLQQEDAFRVFTFTFYTRDVKLFPIC